MALSRDASARLAFVFVPACAFLIAAAPAFIEVCSGRSSWTRCPAREQHAGGALRCTSLDGLLRARARPAILLSYMVALTAVPMVLLLVGMFGLIGGVLSWLLAEAVGKVLLVARLPRALQLASAGSCWGWCRSGTGSRRPSPRGCRSQRC